MSKTVLRVHFLDSSVRAFAIDTTATAESLLKTVVEKLELKEYYCFSIFEKKDNWERCLEPEEKPCELQKSWTSNSDSKEEPHFVFKKKTFIRDDDKEMDDPVAKHLLYIQAVHNVINSDYPCNFDDALRLAGLQAHIVYGDNNPNTHSSGFLINDLKNFIPRHLFSSKKPQEWEVLIFKEHSRHRTKSKEDAKALYLSIVKKWPFYGTTFYPPCKSVNNGRKVPNKVIIGVNAEGILLLKPKDKDEKELVSTHPFTEICSWASSSNSFAFEYGTQSEAVKYTFETKQGAIIAATIQNYIDILVDMLTNGGDDDSTATGTSMGSDVDADD
eukprot:TRINITY_DN4417_c0_g1_i1.p1 TRINITY_DN4417_c0_g1~~TRINITY_DN4417_c0_g1_i1.p1  ORF type:complete len:330 (+),score=62.84 TRINITY_DN4417_c0_g1_i1:130-1119(+)